MVSLIFNLAIIALDFPPVLLFGMRIPMLGPLGEPVPLLGILGSLSVVTAALTSLPLLWLISHIGFRRALIISAALQVASTIMFALLPTTIPLLVAVALTGVAGVLFQVSSAPFMMQQSDATTRDHLFSANTAVNIGFAGLGSLAAGYVTVFFRDFVYGDDIGALAYRATFAVASGGLLLSLVPLLVISSRQQEDTAETQPHAPTVAAKAIPHTPQEKPPKISTLTDAAHAIWHKIPTPWRSVLRRPWPVLRLLISPLLISCGAALLIPYLNLFFQQKFMLPDDAIGLIIGAIHITTGVAALVGPIISIRIGKINTIVLTQLVSLPFLLTLGFMPILGIAVGASLVRAALFNMGSPLYDAFAMERTDEPLRPLVIGLINGAFAAAYMVAPVISTQVQQSYGFAPLFITTCICYALAAGANYWLFVRRQDATHSVVQ